MKIVPTHCMLFKPFSQFFSRKQVASAQQYCCYSTERSVIVIVQHQILRSAVCENGLFVATYDVTVFLCIIAVYIIYCKLN